MAVARYVFVVVAEETEQMGTEQEQVWSWINDKKKKENSTVTNKSLTKRRQFVHSSTTDVDECDAQQSQVMKRFEASAFKKRISVKQLCFYLDYFIKTTTMPLDKQSVAIILDP